MSRQMPEHVAFDFDNAEHHQAIGTTEFDYEQVFNDLDEGLDFIHKTPPTAREQAAELFRSLATWCFRGQRLRPAMTKFVAIISGLRPDLLADRTGGDLARELGITKQALTRQSLRFQDAWHIKFARSRSKEGRARMATARRGGPNRNLGQHQTHDEIPDTSNKAA